MNVSFGLVALWVGFCLGALGVKGRGVLGASQAAGSGAYEPISYGATLAKLLRGDWPYGVATVDTPFGPGTITPNPSPGPGRPPGYIVPNDPNAPTLPLPPGGGNASSPLQPPPIAGTLA